MNLTDLIKRVRIITRDLSNSIFREEDIIDFLNEGIDRCKQVVPELKDMVYLQTKTDAPLFLPSTYHSLLSVYASSRCFAQDERNYQASTYMNEFETKMEEFKERIEYGLITIVDASGIKIDQTLPPIYVEDTYFEHTTFSSSDSFDYPDDSGSDEGSSNDGTVDGGEF